MVDFITDRLAAPEIAQSIINAKGGPTKLSTYRVIMPTLSVGGDAISMDVLCRGATLPGKTLNTVERRTNMKPIETPVGFINAPVDMVFTETNDHTASHYIDAWMNQIIDPDTYQLAWRDDFTRDILIMSNDNSGVPGYICKLKNAYPKFKNQIDFADTSQDTLAELRVQFSYEDYEIIDSPAIASMMDFARNLRTGSVQLPTNVIRLASEGLF